MQGGGDSSGLTPPCSLLAQQGDAHIIGSDLHFVPDSHGDRICDLTWRKGEAGRLGTMGTGAGGGGEGASESKGSSPPFARTGVLRARPSLARSCPVTSTRQPPSPILRHRGRLCR